MKYFLFFSFLVFSVCSFAQSKQTVRKSIDDDGKIMRVNLVVSTADLSLNYDKSFAVTGLSEIQKKMLVDHLIDSLGVRKHFKSEKTEGTSPGKSDREGVIDAVRDYVDGLYEADTGKIERSVAKYLAKRGYYTNKGANQEATMTYDQLVQLTKRWKSSQTITESTPKNIVVLDVLDKIASAKLEAKWGIDYFHLAKLNGRWTIINVLWQDHPSKN
jgi:hypothetical protein